jgi:hypothetical protein
LRNETFFSLPDLISRVLQLIAELNDRPMKRLGGVTRRELFARYERAVLLPLPSTRYEVAE